MTVNMYYATVWKFTKHGVEDITNRFNHLVQDVNVRCTYMQEKHMFRIQLVDSDEPYWEFVDLCSRYVVEQQEKQDQDAFEDLKIIRILETCTAAEVDLDDGFEDLLIDIPSEDLISQVDAPQQADNNTPSWMPKDSDIVLENLLPDDVLQSIAEDTACRLTLNVERSCVIINNLTESRLKAVCNKLDNLERNWKRTKVNAHFVRTEKLRDISTQLCQLQSLPDEVLLRTLTSHSLAFGRANPLPELWTMRMIRHGDGPELMIPALPKVEAKDQVLKGWNTLRFPAFNNNGVPEQLADIPDCNDDHADEGAANVPEWLDEVQENPNLDPMEEDEPVALEFEPLVPIAAPIVQSDGQPRVPRDLDFPENAMTPDPEALIDSETSSGHALQTESLQKSDNSKAALSEAPAQVRQQSNSIGRRDGNMSSISQAGPSSSASTSVSVRGSQRFSQAASSRTVGPIFRAPVSMDERREEHPWERVNITEPKNALPLHSYNSVPPPRFDGPQNVNHFPPLGWNPPNPLPQVQPRPSAPRALLHQTTQHFVRQSTQQPFVAVGQGQEDEDSDEGIVERLQEVSEVETRQFRSTTKHRKGKGKGPAKGSNGSKPAVKAVLDLPDWLPGSRVQAPVQQSKKPNKTSEAEVGPAITIPECSKRLLEILEHAKSIKGRLEMEVSFGRILVQGVDNGNVKRFETKFLDAEEMATRLDQHLAGSGAQMHFIDRMTTSLEEACHLATGHLFEEDPVETKSWYEFHGEDKDQNKIIIKVSSEKDEDTKVVRCAEGVGQAFFHFPKRQWGARFVVNVRQPYTTQELGASLTEGISVLERDQNGSHKVDMSFKASKDLSVGDIYAKRRMTRNRIGNEGVRLHVTEVQQLCYEKGKEDHTAKSLDRPDMVKQHRLWHEAKVTVSDGKHFEQNVQLKTGDDAAWQPQDVLSDELLIDIQTVIDQTVTRLDGVGSSNRGYRGDAEDMTWLKQKQEEKKKKIGQVPSLQPRVW